MPTLDVHASFEAVRDRLKTGAMIALPIGIGAVGAGAAIGATLAKKSPRMGGAIGAAVVPLVGAPALWLAMKPKLAPGVDPATPPPPHPVPFANMMGAGVVVALVVAGGAAGGATLAKKKKRMGAAVGAALAEALVATVGVVVTFKKVDELEAAAKAKLELPPGIPAVFTA